MEKRADDSEIESEHSDEIAAALAAVYMYCKSQDSESISEHVSCEKLAASWFRASRFEGINLNAGKFVSATALKSAKFNWRNAFARRWTALSVSVIIYSLLSSAPVSALERIQFEPSATSNKNPSANGTLDEAATGSKQFLCPPAPPMVVDKPAAQLEKIAQPYVQSCDPRYLSNFRPNTSINIALSSSTGQAEITCPDGARLYEESSHKLLAELPPQSRWTISLDNGPSGKRLCFEGKLTHARAQQFLLASGVRNYETVNYVKRSSSSDRRGFSSSPVIVGSQSPKFSLPVKAPDQPALPIAPKETFHPVAYQTGPQLEKRVTIPPVVPGYVFETNTPDAVLACNGKAYRGNLTVKPRTDDQSFLLINNLDLEDYLLSVVPSEMPSGWNVEALKAQSIAARSYALANIGKHRNEGYDLKASTEDQVYLGVQTEADNSNRAVAETRGLVLKHNGKVVTAFFHSAGGGCTEKAEHVWGGKVPYLKSVPDFDDQSPHFNWNRSVAVSSIEEALRKQGRDIGGLLGIFPVERSPSQRVTLAMVAGTLQTLLLSGEELRKILALPSTAFNIGLDMDAYLVAGRGFGHGLGMSQWGAKYLSEQGYNASQILSYYYKDVILDQF